MEDMGTDIAKRSCYFINNYEIAARLTSFEFLLSLQICEYTWQPFWPFSY